MRGGFSSRIASTLMVALEYLNFIIPENRSTFFRIHEANDPKNNSAGFGNVSN